MRKKHVSVTQSAVAIWAGVLKRQTFVHQRLPS
jgi:hypothetical protein